MSMKKNEDISYKSPFALIAMILFIYLLGYYSSNVSLFSWYHHRPDAWHYLFYVVPILILGIIQSGVGFLFLKDRKLLLINLLLFVFLLLIFQLPVFCLLVSLVGVLVNGWRLIS